MYEVVLSAEARRFYERADAPLARRLNRCFASLERSPRTGNNVKRLGGPLAGAYRYRVGDYRVVYVIDDARVLVSGRRDRSSGECLRLIGQCSEQGVVSLGAATGIGTNCHTPTAKVYFLGCPVETR